MGVRGCWPYLSVKMEEGVRKEADVCKESGERRNRAKCIQEVWLKKEKELGQ